MRKYIRVRPSVSAYVRIDKQHGLSQGGSQQVLDFSGFYSSLFDDEEELTVDNWRTKVIEVVYCSVPFGIQPQADMMLAHDTYWPSDEDYFSLN